MQMVGLTGKNAKRYFIRISGQIVGNAGERCFPSVFGGGMPFESVAYMTAVCGYVGTWCIPASTSSSAKVLNYGKKFCLEASIVTL